MNKFFIIIGLISLMTSIFGLFQVRYYVDYLNKELIRMSGEIESASDALNVLEAEWSYLNNPDRLERLGSDHLKMEPVKVAQIIRNIDNSSRIIASETKSKKK